MSALSSTCPYCLVTFSGAFIPPVCLSVLFSPGLHLRFPDQAMFSYASVVFTYIVLPPLEVFSTLISYRNWRAPVCPL